MDELFGRLDNMVIAINKTNSTLEKKDILVKYDDLKKILYYTYNPYLRYNVTSKAILKFKKEVIDNYDDIYKLLDDLSNRVITGHEALGNIVGFINRYSKYKVLILKIIDKDLKIRLGIKEINKVFENLIPVFEVALANPAKSKYLDSGNWFISRKFDGVRCITIVKDGNINIYSRIGNEFSTLDKVRKEIVKKVIPHMEGNFVLDGEVCMVDEKGEENFTDIMKVIKKKNYTIEKPIYYIFDILSYTDFINGVGKTNFSKRNTILTDIFNRFKSNILKQVEQLEYTEENIDKMQLMVEGSNWEGLMLRKDTFYKGKRSNDILKIKKFKREEYKVMDTIVGPIRIIDKKTNLEKTITTMTAVIIEHKGNEVRVGSGFTIDERIYFYENKDKIVGQIISVQYFEETKRKGVHSLRFPTYKGIYGKKRDF